MSWEMDAEDEYERGVKDAKEAVLEVLLEKFQDEIEELYENGAAAEGMAVAIEIVEEALAEAKN